MSSIAIAYLCSFIMFSSSRDNCHEVGAWGLVICTVIQVIRSFLT